MRVVLVLTLLQFFAPVFFTVSAQGADASREKCDYHPAHNSIPLPALLKEKEETESPMHSIFSNARLKTGGLPS